MEFFCNKIIGNIAQKELKPVKKFSFIFWPVMDNTFMGAVSAAVEQSRSKDNMNMVALGDGKL